MAAGCHAIGAGYDGVFGRVRTDNLVEAAELYFGDHMTPNTGIARCDESLADEMAAALTEALDPANADNPVAVEQVARPMLDAAQGVVEIERWFERAVAPG
ncbi:MAG TPA: hypothetical protein VLH79_02755, partial [Chthonomonadales bacterium]|nr:hypothetical protein [Chthonomonadales bacterium]